MLFIGLDLAWSPRNRSGVAMLVGDEQGGTLQQVDLLGDDTEITDYIQQHVGQQSAIVAVDAPLRVPNETGQRRAETEINRAFRRYEAGAHPANRKNLTFNGVIRGEALVEALEQQGFVHQPTIEAGHPVRQIIEVFPHPAMIALFDLERTLKYKARPKRTQAERLAEWQRYQQHLRALATADPPLAGHEQLLQQAVADLRGQRLKAYEDQIDALFCAYIALYAFRWGHTRCQTFGTLEEGYVFTPVPSTMWSAHHNHEP
ncbi:MAG: DUF429 domain-containing protein [Chloroflexota bacterium]